MTLARGTRVLEHRGTIRYDHLHPTSSPVDSYISSKLLETTDTPEHAFQNLAELTIEEEIMVEEDIMADGFYIDEYMPDEVDDELENVGTFESAVGFSFSNWDECEYQMNDGCLRDFWEMTERN